MAAKTWANEILNEIQTIPKEGIPGRIVVFGQNAEPILTGSGEEDILVAAAEFGKGRIVCMAHDGYSKNFREGDGELKKLHDNIKRWLTRGTLSDCTRIVSARDNVDQKNLESAQIVFWNGGPGKIASDLIEDFVRGGGGLFHCMTPWGWMQLNKGKSLSDAPYYELLLEVGICYTNEYIQAKDNRFPVEHNKACGAHLRNFLKDCEGGSEESKERRFASGRLKFLPGSTLQALKKKENSNSVIWQKEILHQIDSLPKLGVPGRIVVFRESAEPILTGSEEEDVLVAAAEFGKGRVACVAHGGYGDKFRDGGAEQLQEFHNNVKRWLTKGTFRNKEDIVDANDNDIQEKIKSAKIVMMCGGRGKLPSDKLEEFVRNGGSLFHCMTPWGWMQVNNGKPLSDSPYYSLLIECGLCYTDEYINVKDDKFSVAHNKANGAHLLRVLKEVEQHPRKADEFVGMLKRLKYLPESVLTEFRSILEILWRKCNEEITQKGVPTSKHPINNKKDRALLELWLLSNDILDLKGVKAPGIDAFPGDFTKDPPLTCHEFEFKSDRADVYSTSCYLPAGKALKLDIVAGNTDKDWQVMVGCHTDELNKDSIRRWPRINKKVKLTKNTYLIPSAFGGLIYFLSSDKPGRSIKVKLESVVDSPRFRLTIGEEGRELWRQNREAPGLWADIEGELISFTLPSKSVRHLEFDELTSTMKTWDSVIRLYHDLRGTDVSKSRRQWIVSDEQPSAGYMHSGYPIVTHLDVTEPSSNNKFLLNGDSVLKEGRWGLFHEIGHNMQKSWWTFDGTVEVTCNIFTLCAMDSICHLKPWIHSWLQEQMKDAERYLKDGAHFETWKSKAGVGLFVYAQLIHEFGWKSYKEVFRRYEAIPDKERPNEDQNKIDTWYLVFSEVVGYNLTPLARFWGIGLSVEMTKRLGTAFSKSFLPDDEITKMSPERVAILQKQFPNLVRSVNNSG